MRLAERATSPGGLNAIARVATELADAGVPLTDLSDSNPTRHGLLHPGVVETVARHTYDALRYHPDPRGDGRAREALAAAFGGRPDDYWLTASTSQAYSWLLTVLADPGDTVAIPAPGYPLFEPLARFAGVRTADYRLHYVHHDGWLVDHASVVAATADARTRALIAVNPGNPTGAYLRGDQAVLIEACRRRDAVLIADEVFAPFALDASPTTLADGGDALTVTLGGLSKLLCAPQLKLAWIRLCGAGADRRALAEALDAIADAHLPVGGPVAAALPDLLAWADESVRATRARLAANLATARARLADGPYRVRRCEGGWTVMVDVPRLLPSEQLVEHLMRRAHLSVHPGWFYDLADDSALALSLLPEPAAFADGLGRLRDGIDRLAAAS